MEWYDNYKTSSAYRTPNKNSTAFIDGDARGVGGESNRGGEERIRVVLHEGGEEEEEQEQGGEGEVEEEIVEEANNVAAVPEEEEEESGIKRANYFWGSRVLNFFPRQA